MWLFRRARPASFARNAAKTLGQIVLMWSAALAVVPLLLAEAERRLLPGLPFGPCPGLGWTVFGLCSLGGLASAWTLVRAGEGTPLPLDETRRLVVAGTYAYVRNPMAITGIGQALGVGLVLGSPSVVAYALAGAWVWNYGMRPLEELDLEARFGADYRRYRDAVPCWLPRARPWRLTADDRPDQAGPATSSAG